MCIRDRAQTAQPREPPAVCGKVRKENGAGISDNTRLNMAPAVNEHAHLPLDLPGNLRQRARQFRADKTLGAGPSVAQFL